VSVAPLNGRKGDTHVRLAFLMERDTSIAASVVGILELSWKQSARQISGAEWCAWTWNCRRPVMVGAALTRCAGGAVSRRRARQEAIEAAEAGRAVGRTVRRRVEHPLVATSDGPHNRDTWQPQYRARFWGSLHTKIWSRVGDNSLVSRRSSHVEQTTGG
jgi:hypothetical protein